MMERLYVCLDPLKQGFKRPLICLDGCFLKGIYGGQLLVAIGIDANNGFYPIACDVVEAHSKFSWVFFNSHHHSPKINL